jgi:hypothetical protein
MRPSSRAASPVLVHKLCTMQDGIASACAPICAHGHDHDHAGRPAQWAVTKGRWCRLSDAHAHLAADHVQDS